MANEEKMNVDIENQEDFAKKKKITIICLSATLVLITLIAGLFLVKKNKESRYENNDLGEVVDENDSDHEDNDDHEIVNENDKTSGQVITNILLFLITGVLFFFWENDKLPENSGIKAFTGCNLLSVLLGGVNYKIGIGIFEKANWFGLASLGFLIFITLLVELVLHLLLGSLAHLFSKDKNKRYFHTLTMSWKKRKQIFFSFSKTKTFFVIFSYLLGSFVIAMVARDVEKCHLCRCCHNTGEIVVNHGGTYCCGFFEVSENELPPQFEGETVPESNNKK